MAEIVGGFGTSHSPMLLNEPQTWLERADQDRTNSELYDADGANRKFDDLLAAAGNRYLRDLEPEIWRQRHQTCQDAMDRLAAELAGLEYDVVVIVGDDQSEVFDDTIQPAIGIYWGEQWHTGVLENAPPGPFFENVKAGYAMDDVHHFDGSPDLALSMIATALDLGFDITTLARVPEGRGFGHAYGFVIRRLLGDRAIPVIPILLNTYYPPNQPAALRCYRLGEALAEGVRRWDADKKVLFVASGGLSHFVVNESLDQRILHAIGTNDADTLTSIRQEHLMSGTSEIRNWLTVAGAMAGREVLWSEYAPCYRSAAGTGCGMAFLRWV